MDLFSETIAKYKLYQAETQGGPLSEHGTSGGEEFCFGDTGTLAGILQALRVNGTVYTVFVSQTWTLALGRPLAGKRKQILRDVP